MLEGDSLTGGLAPCKGMWVACVWVCVSNPCHLYPFPHSSTSILLGTTVFECMCVWMDPSRLSMDCTGHVTTSLCVLGDASLCYHAIESVSLAVDILNGGYIRQNFQITVAPAEFASKNEVCVNMPQMCVWMCVDLMYIYLRHLGALLALLLLLDPKARGQSTPGLHRHS